MSSIRILQTIVAAYRLALFEHAVRIESDLKVVAGDRYFADNLVTVTDAENWFIELRNSFLLGKSFCWQNGAISELARADGVLAELNPRILTTWILVVARRVSGRRFLFWGHVHGRGRRPPLQRWLRRSMLNLADGIVTYSDSDARDLRESGYAKPIWTAHNSCVVEADVYPAAGRQTAFVFVGRLVPEKKPALMIRAFASFVSKHPGVRLEVVGSGPERPGLEELARELGVSEAITFHGEVTCAGPLRAIYEDALAAVSPGSVGLSAIQSMAHGVPILIARNEPHGPEIEACIEGETCRFFESDKPDALEGCFEQMVQESCLWKERRQRLCDFIRENYTIDRMARILVNALRAKSS